MIHTGFLLLIALLRHFFPLRLFFLYLIFFINYNHHRPHSYILQETGSGQYQSITVVLKPVVTKYTPKRVLLIYLSQHIYPTASNNTNTSASAGGEGSVTVSVRKEGEVTGLLLFFGEGQEVTINGEHPETKCIRISNQREIEVRVIQDGVPQGESKSPQGRRGAAGGKREVIAQMELK